jgi:hypothetical protein
LVREFIEDASFPLLYAALRRSGVLDILEPKLRETIRRDAFQSGAHFETQKEQAIQVLALLNARGMEPLILKGIGLGTRYYPDPWQRPFSDLDIQVPSDAFGDCRAALVENGYRVFPSFSDYYGNWVSKDSVFLWDGEGRRITVEVHHALLYPKGDRRSRRIAPLLEGLESLALWGSSAKVMKREAEAVFLIFHTLVQHRGFFRFLWFYDILRVAGVNGDYLDRETFLMLARTAGIEPLAARALEGIQAIRGLADGTGGDPLEAHLYTPPAPPNSQPPGQGFRRKWQQIWYADGPSTVYHTLFDSLLPDRIFLLWAYPGADKGLWSLRVARWLDLAGRAFGRPSRLRHDNG